MRRKEHGRLNPDGCFTVASVGAPSAVPRVNADNDHGSPGGINDGQHCWRQTKRVVMGPNCLLQARKPMPRATPRPQPIFTKNAYCKFLCNSCA